MTLSNENSKHFIDLLYSTITRMSSNSANCKKALIGILTVLTALVQSKVLPITALVVAAVLVIAFYLIDSYYLYLEKNFRWMEGVFAESLLSDEKKASELLYDFDYGHYKQEKVKGKPIPSKEKNFGQALISFSTWPFYLAMIAIIACSFAVNWKEMKDAEQAQQAQQTEQTSYITYKEQDGETILI